VGRATDAALAGQIVNNLYLGRTFAHTAQVEKQIAAVTAADVKRAFGKHIDLKKLVVIRAGDFKK
jgi:zinc protease